MADARSTLATTGQGQLEVIPTARTRQSLPREELLALLGLALVAGVYFVVRYGGQWAESDSGVMAEAIRVVANSNQLAPEAQGVYANGYGYQAVSMAILAFTGLSIENLQQIAYPIVSSIVVLPAWALYRELTGSSRTASLATLLLLLVPEHLFAVLRGSHERLDRVFLLTALWLLVRSLHFRGDRATSAVHVLLVLLATYGLIATNGLFGMSFVLALGTALVLSWLAGRGPASVRRQAIETTRLMRWAVAGGVLLVAVFILFLYPPFATSLRALVAIPGTLLTLILSGGPSFDPYAYSLTFWVSPVVFLLLSMMNILLLTSSAVIWIRLGWSWLRGGSPASMGIWVLWLLYAAFALQGAVSIVSDRTGALQGNVQYRAFGVFATVAAPLVAVALNGWHPRPWPRKVAMVAIALATVGALMKSTLDPAVSNKWMFYTTAEIQGLRWADTHGRSTDTWVGPDDRLPAAYLMLVGYPIGTNLLATLDPTQDIPSFLVSDAIRLQSARLGMTFPQLESRNLLYDNGEAQLYRQRPAATLDR